MRVEIKPLAQDCRVFLDDGTDVTTQLHVNQITVRATAGELTQVELTCYAQEGSVLFERSQLILLPAAKEEQED